jgi:hypothetical protein
MILQLVRLTDPNRSVLPLSPLGERRYSISMENIRYENVMSLVQEWVEANCEQGLLANIESKVKIVLADPQCDDWEDDWVSEECIEASLEEDQL